MQRKHALQMRLASLALLVLLAVPILAASSPEAPEVAGNIVGLLDEEEREWFIMRQGSDSNATFTELGDQIKIELVGFVEADAWQVRESLSLSITLVDGAVTEFDVLHPIGATAMPPVFTSDNAAVRLALDTFDVEGSRAHVAGRVEGNLAVQTALGEEAALEEGVGIAVAFDAEAFRIEY